MNAMCKKVCTIFDNPNPSGKEISYALLVMRIAVGLFFVSFGFGKLFGTPGLEMVTGMFTGLGFPIPGVLALLVGIAEFFGGLAILLGVMTRFSAFWLALISLVAWATVKSFSFGFGTEGNLDLLALGLTVALLITGPGSISLSKKMLK
jgi:putative oxidoreductase